ncbi:MAG: tail fiber domain-containing protein [bacterium]
MKTSYFVHVIFLLTFKFLLLETGWGQVPATISYQGVILDANGSPVTEGYYALTFKLYETASGGAPIWTEIQTVGVAGGMFNVILGAVSTLNDLGFDKQYWLGVSIGNAAELTPRVKLTSSPYSLNARMIEGTSNVFPSGGNVGIGTKSPTEKLEVDGTIYSMSGGFQFPDGSVQTTAATTSGDSGGWTRDAENISVILTNSGDNVGVGTSNPGAKLEVYGNTNDLVGLRITNPHTGAQSSEGLVFNNEDGPLAGIFMSDDDSSLPNQMGIVNNRPDGYILFGTNQQSRMVIDKDGNVGIGTTTSPQDKLEIYSKTDDFVGLSITNPYAGVNSSEGIYFNNEDGGVAGIRLYDYQLADRSAEMHLFNNRPSGSIHFKTAASTSSRLVVANSGNVGIGTKSPNAELEIYGAKNEFVGLSITNPHAGANSAEGIYFNNEDGSVAGIRLFDDDSVLYPSNQMHIFNNRPGGSIHFGTQGVNKMVVANSGFVGIGTITPEANLHVRHSDSGETADGVTGLYVENSGALNSFYVFQTATEGGGKSFSITNAGNVGIGTTSPQHRLDVNGDIGSGGVVYHSDIRWKKNIQQITNALNKATNLRGVEFEWRREEFKERNFTEGRKLGFIAQEVEKIAPEVVGTDNHGYKSVAYANLTALLVEAMKEQQEQIRKQQATIDALVDRINRLEEKVRFTSK